MMARKVFCEKKVIAGAKAYYYERKREKRKSRWVAIIAFAWQLCKRVYKLMRD